MGWTFLTYLEDAFAALASVFSVNTVATGWRELTRCPGRTPEAVRARVLRVRGP